MGWTETDSEVWLIIRFYITTFNIGVIYQFYYQYKVLTQKKKTFDPAGNPRLGTGAGLCRDESKKKNNVRMWIDR